MASEVKSSNTVEIFSYIARDQKSSVVKGEIKAIEEKIVLAQLKKMGLSYDWSKEISTCNSDYYKHEQKIFFFFMTSMAYLNAPSPGKIIWEAFDIIFISSVSIGL